MNLCLLWCGEIVNKKNVIENRIGVETIKIDFILISIEKFLIPKDFLGLSRLAFKLRNLNANEKD